MIPFALEPRTRSLAGLLLGAALAISSCDGGRRPIATSPPPVEASPPGVPENVRVRDQGTDFIEWQWDPVPGASGYQVQVSIGDDDFNPPDEQAVLPANQTAAEFRDPELGPGTVVHLRVRAFAGSAGSPIYGPFSSTVPGLTSGPDASSATTDRMALEALYQATNGDNWQNNAGWLSAAPLADWHGVETDATGRVTSLALSDNQLSGKIPPELGELARLEHLELSGHHGWLDGTIPSELGQLASLESLILAGNGLHGEIPRALGRLSNLRRLDLSANGDPTGGPGLSGAIPEELGELSSLERLDLSSNHLSGVIPPELGHLTNLTYLNLSENLLTGSIPPELGELANLTVLLLGNLYSETFIGRLGHGNALSGPIPPELGRLTNLEHLDLSGNALDGTIPPEFGQLSRLIALDLDWTGLTGAIPEELTQITPLTSVSAPESVCVPWGPPFDSWLLTVTVGSWFGPLARCPVTDVPPQLAAADRAALEALYKATDGDNWQDNSGWLSAEPLEQWFGVRRLGREGRVSHLELHNNGLSGEIPPELGQLLGLESLELGSNRLHGPIPGALADLINLEYLVIAENRLSGKIPPGLGQLAHLAFLDLSDNQLSGEIPPELGQLSNLTDLALSQNRLTGEIPPELVTLVNLQWLALDDNASLCVPWGEPFDSWINGIRPFVSLSGFSGERCPFAEMVRARDRAALEALYHATDGDNWNNNSGWLNATPPFEQWHGVRRDGNAVVALDLIGNGLRGTIPPELGQLADLEILDLRLNHLRGAIPAELGQLASLEKLNFYANDELSGPIPPELGQLTSLTELTLGRNRLSGTIPAELGQLANLEYLALFTNELNGTIPATLGQLANLKVLDLANNALNGTIPTELSKLTNLTGLHLGNNALSGTIPDELGRLTALTSLDLVSNPAMSGELPSELTKLTRLEWLRLPSGVCVPWGEPFDSWLGSVVARSEYPHLVAPTRCPR